MPKSKQSNIKTRVSRRKPDDDQTTRNSKSKARFLGGIHDDDKKKQNTTTSIDDLYVNSTIVMNKRNTDNVLTDLTPPRHIEVHQENRSTMDKTLRAFDLDYKYGPCVGLSRLQRWERAEALGLDPPPKIKSILLDKNNKDYQECLFNGSVI